MAVEVGDGVFVVEELGVVDQQVDPGCQLDRCGPLRSGSHRADDRARQARLVPVGLDPVAEGAPTLVGNVACRDGEVVDLVVASGIGVEGPVPRRPSGPIGKCGGDTALLSTSNVLSPVCCSGTSRRTRAYTRSPAVKNGRPWV